MLTKWRPNEQAVARPRHHLGEDGVRHNGLPFCHNQRDGAEREVSALESSSVAVEGRTVRSGDELVERALDLFENLGKEPCEAARHPLFDRGDVDRVRVRLPRYRHLRVHQLATKHGEAGLGIKRWAIPLLRRRRTTPVRLGASAGLRSSPPRSR